MGVRTRIVDVGVYSSAAFMAYLGMRGNTVDLPKRVSDTESKLFSPPPLLLQRVMSIAKATGVITPPPVDKINKVSAQQLRIFITPTLSAMSWGSLALGQAAIGVPRTFLCTDVHDPILQTLSVDGTYVSQAVKQALFPLPQSQNFSIAHELGHIYHEDGVKSALLDPVVVVVGGYTVARRVVNTTTLRVTQKAIGLTLLLPMLLVVRATAKWIQELRADHFATTHGYGDGGTEFLQKRLELNRLMRGGDESASLMSLLTHPPPRFRLWCIQVFQP